MEKMGFSKETHEQGYESLDSRANSQAISEHLSYKESKSSALDSTASKAMKKDNDNDDSNETDQVKGNSEAAESKQIQKQKGGKENSSQLKGIVLQANGHWGAQLYCNRARIWLGTFKTREEAAKAYDRANMKFKGQDGQTNFPVSEAEKLFQNSLTCDEVTLLIRDHIYDGELHKWYNAHHNPNQVVSGNAGDMGNICNQDAGEMGKNMIPGGCMMNRQHLFEKELTVSDVGKLNRLVIPKQHAERHFPKDRLDVEETFFLTFVDTSNNREWQFRFSFWESSKSYVLTRGWRRFVKNKDLKGGDLVSFSRDSKMPSNKFYITVQVSENLMSNNCVQDQSLLQEKRFGAISSSLSSVTVPELEICTPKKLVKSHEKIRVDQNSDQKSSNCLHGCTQLGKRKAMEDEIEHKSDDVLKLFGIEIGRKGKQLKDVEVEFNPKAKESLEIQIHSKETKQKDDEAEIESKARNLFGIKTDPEAKGQRDGRDVDLTLRL